MKNIILLAALLFIASCGKKTNTSTEKTDDFLKTASYNSEAETTIVKTYTVYKPVQVDSSNPTYWYVVYDHVGKDEENTAEWHGVVKLNTPYFDFVEARNNLPFEITGAVYFNFIMQTNKETYDSFLAFKDENTKRKGL